MDKKNYMSDFNQHIKQFYRWHKIFVIKKESKQRCGSRFTISGSYDPVFGILLNPDPALPNPEPVRIQIQTNVCMANNLENFTAEKEFWSKRHIFFLKTLKKEVQAPGEATSPPKRSSNINFYLFFLFWGPFWPDSQSEFGSGSTHPTESVPYYGSETLRKGKQDLRVPVSIF